MWILNKKTLKLKITKLKYNKYTISLYGTGTLEHNYNIWCITLHNTLLDRYYKLITI